MKSMIYKNKPEGEKDILDDGEFEGYHYVIVSLGHYPCAYVEIPKNHPWYRHEYDEDAIYGAITCHMGLTFSDDLSDIHPVSSGWYLGWDYGHSGDYIGCFNTNSVFNRNAKKWTTEEILEEVKQVIKQVKEYEGVSYE